MIGDFDSSQIEYFDSMNNVLSNTMSNFHTTKILFLKYLSNGYVASSSDDYTVNVWSPKTWTSIHKYSDHLGYINSLDQLDSYTLVSGSSDQTIRIWKIYSGQTIQIINTSKAVNSIKILSKLLIIACGLSDRNDNLRIYDFTGDLVKNLMGHSDNVNSIEMLSDQRMASGSNDTNILIWDLTTYSVKYSLKGHGNGVSCLKRISANLLASADWSGKIIIWNWSNGKLVYKLKGHDDALWFSSLDLFDEKTLISGSWDRTIKLWNISNGELIQIINANIQINALAMLKTGEYSLVKTYKKILSKLKIFEILSFKRFCLLQNRR